MNTSKKLEILAKFAWLADRMAEYNYEHMCAIKRLQSIRSADNLRLWNTDANLYSKLVIANEIYEILKQKGMQDRYENRA